MVLARLLPQVPLMPAHNGRLRASEKKCLCSRSFLAYQCPLWTSASALCCVKVLFLGREPFSIGNIGLCGTSYTTLLWSILLRFRVNEFTKTLKDQSCSVAFLVMFGSGLTWSHARHCLCPFYVFLSQTRLLSSCIAHCTTSSSPLYTTVRVVLCTRSRLLNPTDSVNSPSGISHCCALISQ